MKTPVLHIRNLQFRWSDRGAFVLNVPEFRLEAGEKLLLLGESGSGKSTLLSLICGIILPQVGEVLLAGRDLSTLSGGARDRYRAEQIGVIFQQFNLLPFGSVRDNILLPLQFAPDRRNRVADPKAEASAVCRALSLPDGLLDQRAGTLSVGQQQRVAVARALIGNPPIILADEPTSALDASNQAAFIKLLLEQAEVNGSSVLMVSHDPRLGQHFDRVVDMQTVAPLERQLA